MFNVSKPTSTSDVNVSQTTHAPEGNIFRPHYYGVFGWDDATWILSSSFIIFTMQSGFGLLEAGMASKKNEVNIMIKNVVDVIFGGFSFWAFGFAFAFGDGPSRNAFCGTGRFFTDATEEEMGKIFSTFFFQLSFATTAITIVSGAMSERIKFKSYCFFSFLGTLIYCFPAHWLWSKEGWLSRLGAIDVAGAGSVHVVGGVTGLVATIILKPRIGRFHCHNPLSMGSPVTAILGMFVLWWGWLGFNCGSTFGITGGRWKLAARSAVNTLNASIGGGIFSFVFSYIHFKRKVDVTFVIVGIIGGLVSITGICALARPWESLLIGAVGSCIACHGRRMLEKFQIDDPTGCISAHALSGMWGLLSIGFFTEVDKLEGSASISGVFKGGNGHLLGVQLLAILAITSWSILLSLMILFTIDKTIGLRVSEREEQLGADEVEHDILGYDKLESRRESALNGLNRFVMRLESENMERSRERHRERHRAYAASQVQENEKEEVVLSVERLSVQKNYQDSPATNKRTSRRASVFTHLTKEQGENSRNQSLTPNISRGPKLSGMIHSSNNWSLSESLPPVE